MADERQMTTHKRHRCRRRHRSYRTLARCIWQRATIQGEGAYAVLGRCPGYFEVQLFAHEAEAVAWRWGADQGCPFCKEHRLERLVDPGEAEGI